MFKKLFLSLLFLCGIVHAATESWQGLAPKVAQVSTATFATYDATTTRTITIGGVGVSAVDSGGNLTAALVALQVVLSASTNVYFTQITWTSDATHIIGTALVPGTAFVFAGSVSGGTGTVSNAFTTTTANSGPNVWIAANFSGGTLPANGDTIIFANNNVSVAYGLDQSGVYLAELRIDQTYTGLIGLGTSFALNADGTGATGSGAVEYRAAYLKFGGSSFAKYNIGQNFGVSNATGSGRLKINTNDTKATVTIYNSAAAPTPDDSNLTAIQLLMNDGANDNIYIQSAPGGVGLAIAPAQTSSINNIYVLDQSTSSKLFTGPGASVVYYNIYGGTNQIQTSAALSVIETYGGVTTISGTNAYAALNIRGGLVYPNSTGTITAAIVENTGSANFRGCNGVTVSSLTFNGGSIIGATNRLTVTSYSFPATYTLQCTR